MKKNTCNEPHSRNGHNHNSTTSEKKTKKLFKKQKNKVKNKKEKPLSDTFMETLSEFMVNAKSTAITSKDYLTKSLSSFKTEKLDSSNNSGGKTGNWLDRLGFRDHEKQRQDKEEKKQQQKEKERVPLNTDLVMEKIKTQINLLIPPEKERRTKEVQMSTPPTFIHSNPITPSPSSSTRPPSVVSPDIVLSPETLEHKARSQWTLSPSQGERLPSRQASPGSLKKSSESDKVKLVSTQPQKDKTTELEESINHLEEFRQKAICRNCGNKLTENDILFSAEQTNQEKGANGLALNTLQMSLITKIITGLREQNAAQAQEIAFLKEKLATISQSSHLTTTASSDTVTPTDSY